MTAVVGMAGIARSAQASLITWGTPTNMVGDADIANTGTYFDAITFLDSTAASAGTVTDNGVVFNAPLYVSGANNDGFISVTSTDSGQSPGAYGNAFTTASPSSSAYSSLTKVIAFNTGGSGTVTIGSVTNPLTIGDTYRVQAWSYYTDANNGDLTAYTGANSVTLSTYITNTTPNPTGQFVIGTITADAITESFTYQRAATGNTDNHSLIDAVSVFDVTAAPEPASISLLALSGIALLRRRRRQSNSVTGGPVIPATTFPTYEP